MNKIVEELDQRLRELDPATAENVERLVRDVLNLAEARKSEPASGQWPEGYFDRTAGALAGEQFERPDQGSTQEREAW